MYRVIDLFAGAGGLSLGFRQTGKFEIAAAYEINTNAQNTYKKNHKDTLVYPDVCSANFRNLKKKLGKIDVVIGGPRVKASQWLIGKIIISLAKTIC